MPVFATLSILNCAARKATLQCLACQPTNRNPGSMKTAASETIPYGVIAQDGLTMSYVQIRDQAILQPGYRIDALVTFPEAGDYCVIDAEAPATASIDQIAPSRRLLGVITASDGQAVSDPHRKLFAKLANSCGQKDNANRCG